LVVNSGARHVVLYVSNDRNTGHKLELVFRLDGTWVAFIF